MAGAGAGFPTSVRPAQMDGRWKQDKLDQERSLVKFDHDDASRQNLIMPTYIFAPNDLNTNLRLRFRSMLNSSRDFAARRAQNRLAFSVGIMSIRTTYHRTINQITSSFAGDICSVASFFAIQLLQV